MLSIVGSTIALLFHLLVIPISLCLGQVDLSGNPDSPLAGGELVPLAAAKVNEEKANQVTVRMSWGGGVDAQWQGSVRYTGGAVSEIRSLGLKQDAPGSVYLENGIVNVEQPSPSAYGGVEFKVEYQAGAEIQAVFRNLAFPDQLVRKSIAIEDVLKDPISFELDAQQNRLTAARAPGDWLLLELNRDHLVFETEETFIFSVQPNLCGIEDQFATCQVRLVPARGDGPVLWTQELKFELDSTGNALPQEFEVRLPALEGVYDLQFELTPKTLASRFTHATRSRSLQMVVLSSAPLPSTGGLWREREVIEPGRNRVTLGRQWVQILRASGIRTGAMQSRQRLVAEDGTQFVELAPEGWQALGLHVSETGKPVLLEIEYVAEEGAALGFSVLQPKSNGRIPTYGFDSGVVVSQSLASSEAIGSGLSIRRHQVVFWPETSDPMLLVSNRSANQTVKFGKVRVLSGPDRLAADNHLPDFGLKDRTRQFMAFYESPMFPENFGSGEIYEAAIDQTLDDWVTFYQGADRLIQYLKAHGYTGTVLTAAADSGSIFPSRHLGATPIFDSGVFFASGQDPIQKDVLEMLFRMFDREGLTLVPAFAFSGPLPELEARIRDHGPEPYRPVDFRGKPASLNQAQTAYSPLNLEVQNLVQDVVGELTQRYKNHQSFKGVSLLCRPDTYTQLSGRRWGYNSPAVASFLDESGGIQLASGTRNDWTSVQNLLLGSGQARWLQWRAKRISDWYKRLHGTIDFDGSGRRLYLSAVNIYRHPDIVSSLSPSLHWSNQLAEAMLELGWDTESLKSHPSIVLLKPNRVDEHGSVAKSKVETQMEQSQEAAEFFRTQTITGEVFRHQTQWAKFAEIQSPSTMGAASQQVLRLQQLTPADWQNRRRFIHSLKSLDSRLMIDGGWLLAMGQERGLIDLIDVYTRLPDLPFDLADPSDPEIGLGPVVIRQAITDGRWYFYCLNDSPWEVQVRLILNRGKVEELQSLSSSEIEIEEKDGKRVVQLSLPPYSLVGGFSRNASNQIIDFDYEFREDVAVRLKSRLNQLQLRLIQATDVQPLKVISNPGFEESNTEVSQWTYDTNHRDEFSVVTEATGQALKMQTQRETTWIRSRSFSVPETGRLSISVWMKTTGQNQPPLRIAVESDTQDYYRFGSTGSLAPDDPSNQIGNEWRQYVVHFDDLPVEVGAQLRIGFDMMGPGVVLIDRVELYDRLFDAHDIQALTQRLAAVRPLVESPKHYDLCRRMLNGYWLSFLNEYIGEVDEKTKELSRENVADQDTTVRTSSIFQRFRNMMTPRLQRR